MIRVKRVTAIWCMSCLVMKKTWKSIFDKYPQIKVIDYDFDEDEALVKTLEIGDILPVLIVYDNDKEVKRIIGEKSKKQLDDIFSKLTN